MLSRSMICVFEEEIDMMKCAAWKATEDVVKKGNKF